MDILISTQWLADEFGAPDLRILDATAFLPGTPRDAAAESVEAHIPGALFLDLATLNDPDDPRPAAVPTEAQLAARMATLGINRDDRIIVYDNSPLSSAGRAWWLLRAFGATKIAILDGGLARWRAEGRMVESGEGLTRSGSFDAHRNNAAIASKADVLANIESCAAQVVDARSADRFRGDVPEPRPGMAEGHIPGSVNLPSGQLLDAQGQWKRATPAD